MAEASATNLKRKAQALLSATDFLAQLPIWRQLPARRVVRPLLSFLCSTEELLRWRAVTALGLVVSQLAETDLEASRTIMRRLIWTLTDESGGIGWGAPEAMGEIMAVHPGLAGEYSEILLSFIREGASSLDNPVLQRGVLWGIARMAEARPGGLAEASPIVLPFLDSEDAALRGLALWALSRLGVNPPAARLRELRADKAEFLLYVNGELEPRRVCDLAALQALPA